MDNVVLCIFEEKKKKKVHKKRSECPFLALVFFRCSPSLIALRGNVWARTCRARFGGRIDVHERIYVCAARTRAFLAQSGTVTAVTLR